MNKKTRPKTKLQINPAVQRIASSTIKIQSAVKNSAIKNNLIKTNVLTKPNVAQGLIRSAISAIGPIAISRGRNNGKKIDTSGDSFDTSELTIANDKFQPAGTSDGISVLRPEILSLFNFHAIYSGDSSKRQLNSYGKFIELNHQASYLHRDTTIEFFKNLTDSLASVNVEDDAKKKLTDIQFASSKNNLENLLKILAYEIYVVNSLNAMEDKFDIKSLSDYRFKTDNHLTVKEIFTQKMGYTPDQYNMFTNSKVYMQMAIDLKNMLENYSFNLLNITDADRKKDSDPTKLDITYSTTNNFKFKIEQLNGQKQSVNALEKTTFDKFVNSMPTNATNRVRILLTLISKELRVSKVLGNKNISKLIKDLYNAGDVGSPFDNIIGIPQDSIFKRPNAPETSLVSLAYIDVDKSLNANKNSTAKNYVLPFEKKYIDTVDKSSTYIPGSSYFIDSIFNTNGESLNLAPLNAYVDQVTNNTMFGSAVIKNLLELQDEINPSPLRPKGMYNLLLTFMAWALGDLSNSSPISPHQQSSIILTSIIKLASKDKELKHLLFQYFILAGIHNDNQSDSIGGDLWDGIKTEIADLRNIPFFKTIDPKNFIQDSFNPNGLILDTFSTDSLDLTFKNSYSTQLDSLAKAIEARVAKLTLNKKVISVPNSTVNSVVNAQSYVAKQHKSKANGHLEGTDITQGQISTALAKSSDAIGLIKMFSSFITEISKQASIQSEKAFMIPDSAGGGGRTRFNFISPSAMLLMNFELFCSFIEKYLTAEFVPLEKGSGLIATWDTKINSTVIDAFKEVIADAAPGSSKKTNPTIGDLLVGALTQFNHNPPKKDSLEYTLLNEIHANKDKLIEEDNVVISIVDAFEVISKAAKEAKDSANSMFTDEKIKQTLLDLSYARKIDTTTGKRLNGTSMDHFYYPYTYEKLKQLKDKQQLDLSVNSYFNILERFTLPENIQNLNELFDLSNKKTSMAMNVVHKDVKNAMYSYLASEDLSEVNNSANTRVKILSVGIPAGFKSNLVDRFTYKNISKTKKDLIKDKQTDLIKVNVYKRETRYSDILFKPQTFLFDMSMFQLQTGIIAAKPALTDDFSNILKKIVLTNYDPSDGTFNVLGISMSENNLLNSTDIKKLDQYNLISDKSKEKLFKNHVESYLLETYINLMTGIKLNEETFTVDSDATIGLNERRLTAQTSRFDKNFETLLLTYITEVLKEKVPNGSTLESLLENNDVSSNVKGIIRTMAFGNELYTPGTVRSKVLNRKTFEKVLNMKVNIDKFEVNVTDTNKTASGKAALEQARSQGLLRMVEDRTYFVKRDENDIILEDLFVTVENII